MTEKYRLIYAAHEILTREQGAQATEATGVFVQSCRSGGKSWHDWAIDMSKCGEAAGGWHRIVDAYLSDERFTHRQREVARKFWRFVRMRRGLYGSGVGIVEQMGV